MALSRDSLSSALRPIFFGKSIPGGSVGSAVEDWMSAYLKYAASATAGGTLPISLSSTRIDGSDFFSALDQSMRTMWMSTGWSGPGLIGVTSIVPPLVPIMRGLGGTLLASRDAAKGLAVISDAIHTYTLSITVVVTTPAGVSTPVLIT